MNLLKQPRKMKRIIIIGASSGLGRRIAIDFARYGFRVGIAARREDRLKEIKALYPDRIEYLAIDVTADDAVARFNHLPNSSTRASAQLWMSM